MQISNPQWYQNGTGVNARDLRELNNMCFGFRFKNPRGYNNTKPNTPNKMLKFRFIWRGIQDN